MASDEYQHYAKEAQAVLHQWGEKNKPYLQSLGKGCNPKAIILEISETLLTAFANIPLIDQYEIYQHLMNYWFDVMQDDVYQISSEGWRKAAQIRLMIDEKGKTVKEIPDIVIGSGKKAQKFKADLIPPALIVERYYSDDKDDKKEIDDLNVSKEAISQDIESLIEMHSGEEGLLEETKNDKDKLTKAALKSRIKEIQGNEDFNDEMVVLQKAQKLLEQEGEIVAKIKALQLSLDKKTIAHYAKLDEAEIKTLVISDKWFVHLHNNVISEIERVTQLLAARIKVLEERYANPMPQLTKRWLITLPESRRI